MSDRISRALRELADALDDEAWEVTRPATGADTQARELLQVVRGRLERPPHGTSTSRRASTSVENPRETASGTGWYSFVSFSFGTDGGFVVRGGSGGSS